MWICVLVSLLMIPLALIPHPTIGPIVHDTFLPTVRGGINSTALLTIIAIVGTTVAPWQLFFQQSNVIDKRITARAIVLNPHAPLGLLTFAVQALAGILLPSATVFLVLLCNDRAVLGPRVNAPWLNVVAAVIVGLLVMLSLILAATTLFPNLDAILLSEVLGSMLVVGLLVMGGIALVRCQRSGPNTEHAARPHSHARSWQMQPLEELPKPTWPLTRKIGLFTLRAYLVIAVILLVVKVIQLALGH